MTRARWLLGIAAILPACLKDAGYHCSSDAQCGPQGICEPAVMYCSFPDSTCGRRFGDASGPYSNQCIAAVGDAGIDTSMPPHDAHSDAMADATPDAPPEDCPSTYMTVGTQPHVYRVITTTTDWMTQKTACGTDNPRAYLAIPDDATELAALDGVAGAAQYWVGIDDMAVEGQFVTVKGAAATFLPWAPGEPNNQMNSDCVAARSATGEYQDDKCNVHYRAICECDPP